MLRQIGKKTRHRIQASSTIITSNTKTPLWGVLWCTLATMPRGIVRFIRYSTVGVSTFLFDLLLLGIFIDILSINYLVATGVAFLCAVSVNYAISRVWVFRGTERTLGRGYIYFIQIALLGAGVTVGVMWFITTFTALHYMLARIAVAGVVGMWNYTMNLFVNFRVAGKALDQ